MFLWTYAEAAAWRDYEPAQFDVDCICFISADQPRMAEYCSKVNVLFHQPASLMADRAALEDNTHLADEEESEYGLLPSDGTQEGGAETRLSQPLPVLDKDSEPQGHDDRPISGHHLADLEQTKDLSVIAAQPRSVVAVKFPVQANHASSDFVREGYGTTDPHRSPLWIKTLGLLFVGAGTRPLAHSSPRKSSVPISCPSVCR